MGEEEKKKYRKASQIRVYWRRFRKHKMGLFGAFIFLAMFFMAIFADFIAPYQWERGADALGDNGPTSSGGEVILHDAHLYPIYGIKSRPHQEGGSQYPTNPEPDESGEYLFSVQIPVMWPAEGIGVPDDAGDPDDTRADKTVLNFTEDISDEIAAKAVKKGRFFTAYYFHTFIHVVDKDALIQWQMWFTDLSDMCAIKNAYFDPYSREEQTTTKSSPILGYAAGSLDVENDVNTTYDFVNPQYGDYDGDSPLYTGINRVILQAVSVNTEKISIDAEWSDMVYNASALNAEQIAELKGTNGRADWNATLGRYELISERIFRTDVGGSRPGEHYGKNATGEVRHYDIGEDPTYPALETYRVPVRQAMWRAEQGDSPSIQIVQRQRGWSLKKQEPKVIPEVRYGLPPWSNSKVGVGQKFLGLPFVADYILGTDLLGHDILTGLIWGSRVSLYIGFVAIFISVSIGIVIGAISGYYGGLVDEFFMRFTDIIISIPSFFLLILAISVFSDSLREYGAWGAPTVMAVIFGALGWTSTCRIVRAEFLALRGLEYAEAARVLGASDQRIIFRHLLPNAMAPVIVNATIGMAYIILGEAGLAYLGLGNPQTPSWGRMLQLAQEGMRFAWWAAIIPGLAIFCAVLAFNMLGDALRDALDPRLKE